MQDEPLELEPITERPTEAVVKRILKRRKSTKPLTSYKGVNKLTIRERNFVKNLNKGHNQTESAILAGYSKKSASVIGSNLMSKGKIIKELDRLGLSDAYLASSIKANIDTGVGVKSTADTATKNIELALKLKGYLGKDEATGDTTNVFIKELNNMSDTDLEARLQALQEDIASLK